MKIPKFLIIGCTFALAIAVMVPALASAQSKLDEKVVLAVQNSNVSSLANWFAEGGNIDAVTNEGSTLLMIASKIGDKPTVELMLSQMPFVDAQNKAGATALMIAAKYGHSHVVKMLLEQGADPVVQNNRGVTAASFAFAYNHSDIYSTLLEATTNSRKIN